MTSHLEVPLRTATFDAAQHLLTRVADLNEIAVVSGPQGSGKTYAIEYFLAHSGRPSSTLTMPPKPAQKEVVVRLTKSITGSCDDRKTSYSLSEELSELLRHSNRVVFIDEAHNLGDNGLEQLRYLHQTTGQEGWALILAGVHLARAIGRLPEFDSRVESRIEFTALAGTTLLSTVRDMTPLLATASDDDIEFIDREFARGELRSWAKFARLATELADALQVNEIDDEVIRSALGVLGDRPDRAKRL